MVLEFTATVEKFPGKGGWHFVRVPSYTLEELRVIAGKNGNVPIVVKVGKTCWKSTIMSMGDQQWFVAIKSDARAKEHVQLNSTVTVSIEPDFARL